MSYLNHKEDIDKFKPGSLCKAEFPIECYYCDREITGGFMIRQGEHFLLLSAREILEINSIECTILLDNCKMWFNIQLSSHIIEDVRGVESYDIPFTAAAFL